jgi:ribosome-binding protein aMBF1 (putative translation factor)
LEIIGGGGIPVGSFAVLRIAKRASEGTVAKRRKTGPDAMTAWLEENPLRQWRMRQPPEGWKRSVLARQLGVSHTAVGSWEAGKRLPLIDAFAKIEELTRITTKAWMDWYNRKPQER